ncbi:MAG: BON domain-containing protein [Betaproteobacteria bacterium]|nr:BON domain-containing protein [Betaproteobacteria bacterium]
MKTRLAAACFVIGTSLAPVAAHAADQDTDGKHPMNYVKDSVITTKIKAKLAAEKVGSLTHIQVDTDSGGAVVLSGTVTSQEEADKAVSIAHATEGVTSVRSTIHVESGR